MPGRLRLYVPSIKGREVMAKNLARRLEGLDGVTGARANAKCASLVIHYDMRQVNVDIRLDTELRSLSTQTLAALPAAQDAAQTAAPDGTSNGAKPDESGPSGWSALSLPTTSLAMSLLPGPFAATLGVPLLAYNAWPIVKRAMNVLTQERRLNVDFLDSLAIIVSILKGNLFTGAFMTWLISLGDSIRDHTAGKSKRAIGDLLGYLENKAWVLRGRKKVEIPVRDIRVGDTVIIYAGGMIPVDGKVLKGWASVDQKTITGESLPVDRRVHDPVFAATTVQEGKLYLRATRVGAETTAAQIVRLVESAPVGETRMQNYAEKFADGLVAPSLGVAGGIYGLTGDLDRFLSMVIIDYGTGIRVAAPTAVLAAMTHAARQGIIIKSGSHMEKLDKVDTIIFDKTGTLTRGVPRVLDVVSYDERRFPSRKLLGLAAAAEARLKHPVSQAILTKAREARIKIPDRVGSRYHLGLGVEVRVNGYTVHVGSEQFLRKKDISLNGTQSHMKNLNEKGYSTLLMAVDGKLTGMIPYNDQIRSESSAVIKTLRNRGARQIIMLTGDNSTVARVVSLQLGIDRFFSETLPSQKAEIIQQFQKEGRVVAMVGDGINDSPALSYADVGIAMRNGADVARAAADVVLMEENLWKLISAIDISKEAIGLIRQNYHIIAGLNTLAYALAIPSGMVSPDITALISNGSAILAGLNAIRPILPY